MSSTVFFSGMMVSETLEMFLDRVVRPDTTFLEQSHQVIDAVVRLLHKKIPYSVNQVIKGGSMGKGTAVRHKSDVDLLVVLNDFKTIEDLERNLPEVLSTIEEILETAFSQSLAGTQIKETGRTPFTLQFRLKYKSFEWFDVDLLPIIDVWSNWLFIFDGKQLTYDRMQNEPSLRNYYAKCLTKLQIEFVKPLPAKAKDLIRLLKYWNKMEDIGLSSYAVELLVIYVWERQGSKNNFTLKTLMAAVVKELCSYRKLKISWNRNYNPKTYCRSLSAPFILDPADPFNNLAPRDWSFWRNSNIENKAQELERRLRGLPEEGRGLLWTLGALGMGAAVIIGSILAR